MRRQGHWVQGEWEKLMASHHAEQDAAIAEYYRKYGHMEDIKPMEPCRMPADIAQPPRLGQADATRAAREGNEDARENELKARYGDEY